MVLHGSAKWGEEDGNALCLSIVYPFYFQKYDDDDNNDDGTNQTLQMTSFRIDFTMCYE